MFGVVCVGGFRVGFCWFRLRILRWGCCGLVCCSVVRGVWLWFDLVHCLGIWLTLVGLGFRVFLGFGVFYVLILLV